MMAIESSGAKTAQNLISEERVSVISISSDTDHCEKLHIQNTLSTRLSDLTQAGNERIGQCPNEEQIREFTFESD
jgi:hypothetical protein